MKKALSFIHYHLAKRYYIIYQLLISEALYVFWYRRGDGTGYCH